MPVVLVLSALARTSIMESLKVVVSIHLVDYIILLDILVCHLPIAGRIYFSDTQSQ